jgi:uncharacterized membrane protein YoaT (DUF817 family)
VPPNGSSPYHGSELIRFGGKNARACVFPVFIFAALALSQTLPLPMARYDFLLLACLAMQGFMLATGLETRDELKVITLFHLLGLALELFKVHAGSWSYPEDAVFKVGGVPLYSGFMYASVASYMIQAWRLFGLRFLRWPPTAGGRAARRAGLPELLHPPRAARPPAFPL